MSEAVHEDVLAHVEDGVGTIEVPWGALEVREDLFSGYSVRAVASQ